MRSGGSSASAAVTGFSGANLQSAPGPVSSSSAAATAGPPSGVAPIATYRHLLSAGSLHPANPLRVVAHCDVDAAYAQFESARLGIDSFKVPVAVQQWQGLIAISYKAREYGINRHCDIDKARKLCPDLVNVHVQTIAPGASEAAYNENPRPETHKVSLDPYRRESRKILAVFKQTCPLGQVEKASIDESYFDLTLEVRKLILARYPHLAKCPDVGQGMDEPLPAPPLIEWSDEYGVIMPINGSSDRTAKEITDSDGSEGVAPNDTREKPAGDALDLSEPTWTDVALAHGAILMAKVRRQVLLQLGYTTSGGVASNKTLAKLCSGYRKPNNQTMLLPRAIPAFLRDLPVSKIRFLGGKLGREIGEIYDATTVGDLWNIPLESMQTHFGPEAHWVHAVLRGVDHAPVSARIASKTMLASKNLRPPIRRRHEALGWLDTLATELVVRLREIWEDERVVDVFGDTHHGRVDADVSSEKSANAQQLIPTVWPKLLVLRFIRARDGPRSRQAAFPYISNLKSDDVYKAAERLWYEACEEMQFGQRPASGTAGHQAPSEIVTIALGFSGLERAEAGQKTIERFLGAAKKRKLDDETVPSDDGGGHAAQDDDLAAPAWCCEECGERIRVTSSSKFDDTRADESHDVATKVLQSEAQHRLALHVQDHRDWHFALKLSREHDEAALPASTSSRAAEQAGAKRQKTPKRGSLQSFFAKQTR